MPTLSFRKLSLTDFRNYRHAELVLDGRPVVLTGPNGAGKTNVLEAISMLSPGRGLRSARLGDLARKENTENTAEGEAPASQPLRHWAVSALVDCGGDETRIGTGLDPSSEAPRRIVRIDGKTASGTGALAAFFSVVWLTPQMDRLFMEGGTERRRFLDRLVLGVDPGHSGVSATFDKARRERQKLLEASASGARLDAVWLAALEAAMAESGVAVSAARLDFARRLQDEILRREDEGTAFPLAYLRLVGVLEGALERGRSALEVEDWYLAELAKRRARDGAAGRATLGPGQSDLEVVFGPTGRPAKECSTGEQKALLIGIVLANARLKRGLAGGAPPILLLDEIAAHLDPGRRLALFDELDALGAQAFMTGTEAALFEGFGGRAEYVDVENGSVTLKASN